MLVGPPTRYFREVDRKRWSSCLHSCRARNVSRLITPSQRRTEDTSALHRLSHSRSLETASIGTLRGHSGLSSDTQTFLERRPRLCPN